MGEISTIGLDIAKSVFQVHGVDADGAVVIRKRVSRAKVLEFFAALPSCLVGIEACPTAHYWSLIQGRSPFWIMLLLVWRRSEHGMISPQRRLPSRFRGRTWRDGGSWQRQHHGDQLGKHHGDWWSCDAGPSFWPDLQSRKTCSHQTEGNAIASPSWVR